MQSIEFEFETELELRETVNKLWDTMGVSGELSIRPMTNGRWRMEITSEKEVKESTLEKFAKFRIESGD
jgi:hypothetical protein